MRLARWGLSWLRWGALVLLIGDMACHQLRPLLAWGRGDHTIGPIGMLIGMAVEHDQHSSEESQPQLAVTAMDDGYRIHLRGEFFLEVKDSSRFWLRMVILFLRQLEGSTPRQGSRATRDGRRPLLSQQRLAAWFGVPQPRISQWEQYWLEGDWANLLSLHSAEVLTVELRDRIVSVFARFPWWGIDRVYTYLREQGMAVTHAQVKQASRDSGWASLKNSLQRFFVIGPQCIHPRDEALVGELLLLVQTLVDKVTLPPQEQLKIAHLQAATAELGLIAPPLPAVPWAQKMKWVLFAADAPLESGVVRCTYCDFPAERCKGRKPRIKRYKDEQGQWQGVEVYRYYCDNPDCPYATFTHFPLGLLPYSPYPLEMRLKALQMYAWGRSSYRRTAEALGVTSGRAYQWTSAFGQELLPVAALFGVVRSSGVVGIDEKWVQVPDKAPRGSGRSKIPKRRRWMYVYLAVDVYTYDLLHIAIYTHNTADSTRTFLLALKAKGYKPRVIVTDLRKEYGPALQSVFSQSRHHECLFHAMQWTHRQLKDVYGSRYAETHPEAVQLKQQIKAALQAKTKRTAEKRYQQVMALREGYVDLTPEVAAVFDSLQRHWPRLVNAIESTIIPRTNNAVELVIRRFDQHYQNFCGFESLESARLFLGVFEKVYRFTPFTQDAQERVRGKCPLELAGYEVSKLPMAQTCRGWALAWPVHSVQGTVPNA
jgi:hypothetical protein